MDRKSLTFEQAEGVAPLPTQLARKEVSDALRAQLWAVFHDSVTVYNDRVTDPWNEILAHEHVMRSNRMIDEYDNRWRRISTHYRQIFEHGNYIAIFGFLQHIIRHPYMPDKFISAVDEVLKYTRAAYRVVDGDTFAPVASEEELRAIQQAVVDTKSAQLEGARQHLKLASTELSAGRWADSIRESIHAVESTARAISGKDSLGKALAQLEKTISIHTSLRHGFGSIYGYTSDEKGIRHPMIDDANAKVDETDAIFMLGACSSFVSYLIGKARSVGILKN